MNTTNSIFTKTRQWLANVKRLYSLRNLKFWGMAVPPIVVEWQITLIQLHILLRSIKNILNMKRLLLFIRFKLLRVNGPVKIHVNACYYTKRCCSIGLVQYVRTLACTFRWCLINLSNSTKFLIIKKIDLSWGHKIEDFFLACLA